MDSPEQAAMKRRAVTRIRRAAAAARVPRPAGGRGKWPRVSFDISGLPPAHEALARSSRRSSAIREALLNILPPRCGAW